MTQKPNRPHALDLSLYLIVDPAVCGGMDGMVATAVAAVENGVTVIQLRSETMCKRDWYMAATRLQEVLLPRRIPLLIDDQVDVALAVDATGVHIGQNDLPVAVTRRLIGPEKWLGLSVGTPEHIAAVSDEVDYLGIGPVFPTASKSKTPEALGLDGLRRLVALKRHPAVAIGGVKTGNAKAVMACGVEGICVISAICGQPDVAAATRTLRKEIE